LALAPVLTEEARLKRRVRAHLRSLGLSRGPLGELVLPDTDKDTIRAIHSKHRRDRIDLHRAFLKDRGQILLKSFANGNEIDPERIRLRIQEVTPGTEASEIFRLATLIWSVPVSNGFGRRLKYLVWDEQNGKLVGLFALGDPVFNLSVRDSLIGWSAQDRAKRLVNILDAYVLGAVPPYNDLLGGKAVACLVRSREVFDDFARKYGNASGTISGENKKPSLLVVTTSSSLGRSSVYNRLKLNGLQYFRPVGFTAGWGHFHFPDQLFADLRVFLRNNGHIYADRNRFGQGPNWRMRTLRVALQALGFDENLLRHGIRREVFLSTLAANGLEILKSGTGDLDLRDLKSVNEISSAAVARWMLPRSQRRPEYRSWVRTNVLRLISAKSSVLYKTAIDYST
jgi:hypothetical protein